MKRMHESQLSPSARNAFKLIEFDEDEKLLYEIRKHWFGLYVIYVVGTFITFSLLGVALASAVFLRGADSADFGLVQLQPIVVTLTIILSVLSVVMTAIAAFLYKSNVILITSEKISQVLYKTIFDRQLSQLSIGDIQDVTVRKQGLLAHLFNYGTLVIETAGEQANYNFTFAPDPYEAAKAMVNAHEENLKKYGN